MVFNNFLFETCGYGSIHIWDVDGTKRKGIYNFFLETIIIVGLLACFALDNKL